MDEISEGHLEPTAEISLETVKERSVRGVVVLTGRTFILQIIAFIAQIFLWLHLHPSEYGIFLILSAVINFLTYFSDIGLAAALVQKKEKPADIDLKTTFLTQQILTLFLVAIVFMSSHFISQKYSLTKDGTLLLYALAVSFFLSSLKTIPSVLLERKLEFVKLVLPQILEQVVYNVVLIFFAIKGFGVNSFTYAVLTRSVVGLIAIYMLQPWLPGFAFSKSALAGLFKFGIPYQINTFLATLKDDGMTLVLGGILGSSGIGFLGTAQRLARYPLTFFMDTVTKVTFPAFSRMQEHKSDLERSVTRSIFFICFLVFPSLVGIVILTPLLVDLFSRFDAWKPALTPMVFISINFIFAAATTQLTNLLNAIGKIKITFFLMIMWTVLTWILLPILAVKYGVNGASIGYALVGASSVVAIAVAKRFVNFSLTDSMIKPMVGAGLMGLILLTIKTILPVSIYALEILVAVGAVSYIALMIAMMGISLIEDAKRSFKTIFSKG